MANYSLHYDKLWIYVAIFGCCKKKDPRSLMKEKSWLTFFFQARLDLELISRQNTERVFDALSREV